MRTRLAPLAFVVLAVAAAVPLVLRCGDRGGTVARNGSTAGEQIPLEYRLSGLRHVPIPCDEVGDHIPPIATPLNGPIEISLDAGELTVSPPVARVERGRDLQWSSSSLVWAVTFTENESPYAGVKMPVQGAGSGGPAPAGAAPPAGEAEIPQDAACGMYHYLAAAYDPDDPDRVYILDPPLYIE